jgi:hypothetical protein
MQASSCSELEVGLLLEALHGLFDFVSYCVVSTVQFTYTAALTQPKLPDARPRGMPFPLAHETWCLPGGGGGGASVFVGGGGWVSDTVPAVVGGGGGSGTDGLHRSTPAGLPRRMP